MARIAIVQREIQSQLGVAECGHKDRDIFLVGGFENAAPGHVLAQVLADGAIQLPRACGLVRVPLVKHGSEDALHLVEVLLRLQGVVDAVVARFVELDIVHLGIVDVVRAANALDQAMRHQGAGGDQGAHDAAIDEVGDHQSLLGDGHGAG